MIRIKSKKDGFRRCGIAHPGKWVEYPDGRFSPEEMKILEAEPMLQVEKAAGGEEKGLEGKAEGNAKKKGGK